MPAPLRTQKHYLLLMVVGILLLDGLFVGAYYVAGLATASPSTRAIFTALWTLATVVVVYYGLSNMRRARRAARSATGNERGAR